MGVSYNKLFKLLIDRGMKKKDLQEKAKISSASVSKLAKNECVRLEVLIKVCIALGVDFGDIMEVVSNSACLESSTK
ncbi:MAG: helix-turn-helix domain-containing protein [Christensenellales bacterium]|jgi:putative transcriptional regulator